MYYIPKKIPKAAGLISVGFYGAAAVFYVLGEFLKPRLAFQLPALVLIALGVFFTSRYILTDYKYVLKDIERKGEEVTLTVVRVNGKRETVVASFDLLDAYAFEKCKTNTEFEQKHGKVDKIYNYVSNLFSEERHMLAFTFNGKKVALTIELCPEFVANVRALLVNTIQKYGEENN